MRRALRAALEQTRSDASQLRMWKNRAEELENERRRLPSLTSQLSDYRRRAADAQEALLRMKDVKNAVEDKVRLLALEKEVCSSRLREWESRAAYFENLQKDIEDRENRSRTAEKSLIEKEAVLEQRARTLETEYVRKRTELVEFKEQMRAEVDKLKAHDGRHHE